MSTWVIVGATRGIGLEFVRQLLERGDQVFATARSAMRASELWSLAGAAPLGACRLLECDVTEDASINVGQLEREAPVLSCLISSSDSSMI